MEEYKLAEKQVLTELPKKYPKLFEIFIIIKMFLSACFSTEIVDDSVYYTMVSMWGFEFAISIVVLIVTFTNKSHSVWVAIGIVFIIQIIATLIHLVIGNTKTYKVK